MEEEDSSHGSISNARKRDGEDTTDDSNPYEEFCSISISTPKKKMRTSSPEADWQFSTASITINQKSSSEEDVPCQNTLDEKGVDGMDSNVDMEDFKKEKNIRKTGTARFSYPCQGPGCQEEFNSVAEHDMHYNTRHRNICTECKRYLKSRHLLDLHLMEKHDSFFAILSLKKPMFMCLIETCTDRFMNPEERRVHCVAEHPFLKKYLQTISDSKVLAAEAFVSTEAAQKQKRVVKPKGEVTGKEPKQGTSSGIGDTVTTSRGDKKSTHVSFGHHEGRFIPRQVFAMQKKKNLEKKPDAEMVDLSDLQKSLQ